ncbi:MAG: hypothetical protein ACI9G9_001491 [Psychromonas sp.]
MTTNASQTNLKIILNNITTDIEGGEFLTDCSGTLATGLSSNCFEGIGNMQRSITGFSPSTTYYFRAGNFESFGDTQGNFELCIREFIPPPAPANDLCNQNSWFCRI